MASWNRCSNVPSLTRSVMLADFTIRGPIAGRSAAGTPFASELWPGGREAARAAPGTRLIAPAGAGAPGVAAFRLHAAPARAATARNPATPSAIRLLIATSLLRSTLRRQGEDWAFPGGGNPTGRFGPGEPAGGAGPAPPGWLPVRSSGR